MKFLLAVFVVIASIHTGNSFAAGTPKWNGYIKGYNCMDKTKSIYLGCGQCGMDSVDGSKYNCKKPIVPQKSIMNKF